MRKLSFRYGALAILLPTLLFFSVACEKKKGNEQTCEGTLCVEKLPFIEWSPPEVTFDRGSVDPGAVAYSEISITNSGEGVLSITSVQVEVDATSTDELENPAFFLETDLGEGVQLAPVNQGDAFGLPEELVLEIGYRRYDGDLRSGAVKIYHGTEDYPSNKDQDNPVIIGVSEEGSIASLLPIPNEIVFQNVKGNTFSERNITFLNAGKNELLVSQVQLFGDETFSVFWDPDDDNSLIIPGDPIDVDPNIVIGPGNSIAFKVRFQPLDESSKNATLVVMSNDPSLPEGLNVPLLGNQTGPCIKVEPQAVNFGAKLLNSAVELPIRMSSCGKEPLKISAVGLDAEGSSDYELDTSSFTVEGNPGSWPSSSNQRTIPVGGQGEFKVVFRPTAEAGLDGEGKPVPEANTITIKTNTFEEEIPVPVAGYGTNKNCPTAVITFLNGSEQVPPQTDLNLTAADSLPTTGPSITKVKWYVEQPDGSASAFTPSEESETVFFQVNVAGTYVFKLEVRDEKDWSCEPAERQIAVIPDESIHVELTWVTPGDENPGDHNGADMDLHFVHWNNASQQDQCRGEDIYPPHDLDDNGLRDGDGILEGYFDQDWDTFWFYPEREWGDLDSEEDNPSLDRDDTDGEGPENLNLNVPEDGVTYRVGVHYFADHGKGPSTPAVNIYIYGALLESIQGCSMSQWDLWDAAAISWPDATIDLFSCNGQVPSDAAGSWPTMPCGASENLTPEGGQCERVIYNVYTPCNFITGGPYGCMNCQQQPDQECCP